MPKTDSISNIPISNIYKHQISYSKVNPYPHNINHQSLLLIHLQYRSISNPSTAGQVSTNIIYIFPSTLFQHILYILVIWLLFAYVTVISKSSPWKFSNQPLKLVKFLRLIPAFFFSSLLSFFLLLHAKRNPGLNLLTLLRLSLLILWSRIFPILLPRWMPET